MIIKRDLYLNKLISHMHNDMIKIVSGVRRSGKSYLLFELFTQHLISCGIDKNHIIALQLDDLNFNQYQNPYLAFDYIKAHIHDDKMHYILIDEIQLMDNFTLFLNTLLHQKNMDVYVSGSNSKFLSSDVVTEFRGRGDEIKMYPLNFMEFSSTMNDSFEKIWDTYSLFGGMPALIKFESASDKINYLQNLFKETYLKDVIERNHLRNPMELNDLLNVLASNIGGLISPQKILNTFKSFKKSNISLPTIMQYLEYLEDAFLIQKVQRYDIKGKNYINTPYKYYFTDIGLRNARIDFRQSEPTHTMENIIYNELVIKGFKVDIGNIEIRQERNKSLQKKQLEIDFVANLGIKRYYIQSAFNMDTGEKRAQETASLLHIHDSFKKIIIVKEDIVPKYDEHGILILGLKDFLSHENALDF